jgi:serine phosphatase RsbU (regulator of sigma subunit)
VVEIKGDKKSLGYDIKQHPLDFKVFECALNQQSSSFFVFSDGVTDQVGGQKKLMYGKKRVLNQIREAVDVKTAVSNIVADVERYQGINKRRDDLTLFGFAV